MAPQVFPYILFFCFYCCITHAHLSKSSDEITFSLETLNHLNGAKKGDNLKGVHDLKKYLSYLGYLNYTSRSDNQNDEAKNIFDGSLEFALRKYQEFYNLNITGVLNNNTLAQMKKCRKMLDFSNPGNMLWPGPFHTVSHYSFFDGLPKWSKRRLKYAFDKNLMNADAKKPLERALKQWAASTNFRFTRVSSLRKADIKISFVHGDHGDGFPFVGSDAPLGHTFPPPDGRVHFNAAETWSSRGDKNAFDIETVGTHEFGHALGLGHSTIREAIMYPIICEGEIRKLHEDDINGIKSLYK